MAVKVACAISAFHDDVHHNGCTQTEEPKLPKSDNVHAAEGVPLISSWAKASPLLRQHTHTRISMPLLSFVVLCLLAPHLLLLRIILVALPSHQPVHLVEKHSLLCLCAGFSLESRVITSILYHATAL